MSQDHAHPTQQISAEAGISSGAAPHELIKAGRVEINGQIQREPGIRITPGADRFVSTARRCNRPKLTPTGVQSS
jgi:23S rRNA pseudouridine2605 synthase